MEKGAKILVVNNEPKFTADLQAALESKTYQVLVASDREQAEETVCHEKPDLIILGTIMPRGDEFRLHQWLKQNPSSRRLPLIVIHAPLENQLTKGWTMEEGLWLDAEDYFCKPMEPTALVREIDKLLDKVTGKIKVLVVDEHTVVRQGIHAVVDLQRDMHVVGEAVNGKEAVAKTRQLLPDVVLMDIVMPDMNGLEATKQICEECPQVKVLILSQYDDENNIHTSEQAGAVGFIPKRSAGSELIAGIRSASRGEHFKHPVAM